MALITRDTKASVDASTAAVAEQLSGGLIAGENLDPLAPCYIDSDGKVYMSNGAQAGASPTVDEQQAAKVDGFTPVDYRAGEPVTIYGRGMRARYGSALTPGTDLYLAATKGRLDDAASTLGTKKIVRVISATDIVVLDKA